MGTAIVTGAGSGLGRAVARQLAATGSPVAVLDRNEEAAAATAEGIVGDSGTARGFAVDVRDHAAVASTVAEVVKALGAPSALVNAAAIQRFGHADKIDPSDWQEIIDINLSGTYYMCRSVLPHMIDAGRGAIVNIASTAGLTGMPYDVAYCAAKGGVIQMTKALAVEYSTHRIRVNAVAPGGMETPMLRLPFPEDASPQLQQRVRRSLLGVAQPDDVANVVCFLLSEAASYMTGSIVVADGGSLA